LGGTPIILANDCLYVDHDILFSVSSGPLQTITALSIQTHRKVWCWYKTFNIKSIYSKLPAAKERRNIYPTTRVPSNYAPSLPYFVSGVDRAEIRSVDMT